MTRYKNLRLLTKRVFLSIVLICALPSCKKAEVVTSCQPIAVAQAKSLANTFTVSINSEKNNGSGVIFAKNWNTYYVLTVEHSVSPSSPHQITTFDGETHKSRRSSLQKIGEGQLDLAILTFKSRRDYPIATLANYAFKTGGNHLTFLSGLTSQTSPVTDDSNFKFSVGSIVQDERGASEMKSVLSIVRMYEGYGYELVYTNISEPGMSGGPVLDICGQVIGVHAGVDAAEDSQLLRSPQLSYSLGIPISTFESLVKDRAVNVPKLLIHPSEPSSISEESRKDIENFNLSNIDVNALSASNENDWLRYGNQLWRLQRYDDAVIAYDKAIEINTQSYYAHYGKGLALKEKGEYEGALAALQKSIEIKPFYHSQRDKGIVLTQLKRYPEALVAFDEALRQRSNDLPTDTAIDWWKSDVFQAMGDYESSVDSLNKVIDSSHNYRVYWDRGFSNYKLDRFDEAISDTGISIDLNPENEGALLVRGASYRRLGKNKKAKEELAKAIELNPASYDAHVELGVVHLTISFNNSVDRPCDILSNIESALCKGALSPVDRLFSKNRYTTSLEYLSKAIDIDSNRAEAYHHRSKIYWDRREQEKAAEDINKAIELDPNDANAYVTRAYFFATGKSRIFGADQSTHLSAISNLNRALEIDPKHAFAYSQRATIYKRLREYEKAVKDYELAAKLYLEQGLEDRYDSVMEDLEFLTGFQPRACKVVTIYDCL